MQYEIKSMLPSLVYYNWLILRMLRRNVTHSQFKIRQSVKRFINNVTLVDQEWLKPRVALFCRRKNTLLKYLKYQQLLLTTVSTSLVVMTTSRNWLKNFSQRTPRNSLKLNS